MTTIAFSVLAGILSGCSSAKPAPAVPVAVNQAGRAADQAAQLSEQSNWPAAARQWRLAADRYGLLNEQGNQAIALHNLGQAVRETGGIEEAHQFLEQAAAINEKLGRTNEWWRDQIVLLQLEALRTNRGALPQRLEELSPRAAQLRDGALRGLFLNELGLSQSADQNYSAARQTFDNAESAFHNARDAAGTAAVTANRAELLEKQSNFKEALKAWRSALTQFEALADPRGITRALAGQGRVLLAAQEDLPASADLLRRAAQNYRTLQQAAEQRATLELLDRCLTIQNRSSEAETVRSEIRELQAGPAP